MCELFATFSRVPSTVSLSLEEFSRHGGLRGPHKDGWGLAWYEAGHTPTSCPVQQLVRCSLGYE
jgi:predicted glutamine amidotransferase